MWKTEVFAKFKIQCEKIRLWRKWISNFSKPLPKSSLAMPFDFSSWRIAVVGKECCVVVVYARECSLITKSPFPFPYLLEFHLDLDKGLGAWRNYVEFHGNPR
jgi:hypothetical protein